MLNLQGIVRRTGCFLGNDGRYNMLGVICSMKVLFIRWVSFMWWGIEEAFKKLNIDYDVFDYSFDDWEHDDSFCGLLSDKLKKEVYDIVFSVNFMSLASNVCQDMQIKYYSWVYDCPLNIRDFTPLFNDCNEVFFFDRQQAAGYKAAGVNAHHLLLAADTSFFDAAIASAKKEDIKRYCADVSMVGQLYKTDYMAYSSVLEPYLRGYLEGIIAAQSKLYGAYLIPELVREDLLEAMNLCYADRLKNVKGMENFQMGRRELEYMLACEVTGRERRSVLSLLAKRYDTALYSGDNADEIAGLRQGGYVNCVTEMPVVFNNSRVNLNVSLKTISSGIPLRVIDIMGCGGFVLTNYQEEIAEYLMPGEACVVYESLEDMCEKAQFYLSHDDKRKQIAINGRKLMERDFTFEARISQMFGERLVRA